MHSQCLQVLNERCKGKRVMEDKRHNRKKVDIKGCYIGKASVSCVILPPIMCTSERNSIQGKEFLLSLHVRYFLTLSSTIYCYYYFCFFSFIIIIIILVRVVLKSVEQIINDSYFNLQANEGSYRPGLCGKGWLLLIKAACRVRATPGVRFPCPSFRHSC